MYPTIVSGSVDTLNVPMLFSVALKDQSIINGN